MAGDAQHQRAILGGQTIGERSQLVSAASSAAATPSAMTLGPSDGPRRYAAAPPSEARARHHESLANGNSGDVPVGRGRSLRRRYSKELLPSCWMNSKKKINKKQIPPVANETASAAPGALAGHLTARPPRALLLKAVWPLPRFPCRRPLRAEGHAGIKIMKRIRARIVQAAGECRRHLAGHPRRLVNMQNYPAQDQQPCVTRKRMKTEPAGPRILHPMFKMMSARNTANSAGNLQI